MRRRRRSTEAAVRRPGRRWGTVSARATEISRDLKEAQEQLTAASEARGQAQQAYDAISGSTNAAIAEAKRQEALAAMATASERFLKVATASRLLRWAIDKYRDRNQGPMLARAAAIFSALTLGNYRKLIVEYEDDPPSLIAQRANGQLVPVPGLSEGTRDQLFPALRLAALELHLTQASALPFIADDLFINFDDDRAKAGLQALRDLSKQTEVIFLSHHDHMLPAIRSVMGQDVNVVQLT